MSSGQEILIENAKAKGIEDLWIRLCNIIKENFEEIRFFNKERIVLRTFKGQSIIQIDGDYDIEILLNILSVRLDNDIYGFEGSNPVDGFSYWHYKNQKLIRRLDFGLYGKEERKWNIILGEAEYWEEDFFFGESRRQGELFSLKEREMDIANESLASEQENNLIELENGIEEDRRLIDKIFSEKQLILNTSIPYVGNCANEVVAKMNFESSDNPIHDQILEFRRSSNFTRLINLLSSKKNQNPIQWI